MSIKYTAWETQSSEETLHKLLSSEDGLTDAMVFTRQQEDGLNKLPDQKKVFWWHIAFSQFMSPLIIILFLAAIVSGFFGEWVDALVIFAAIFLNAGVGFIQEYKANQSLEQIRSLVQPYVLVMREGKKREIPAQDLVLGDILFLQQGDQVGADARLLDAVDLEINKASLTGEPKPVKKNTSFVITGTTLAERLCMVYAGTTVLSGRGKAVVVATGIHTEIGQIAHLMLITEEEATPLQKELKRLAKGIAITVMML